MMEAVKLVVCSFFSSLGFGIVFRMERKYLLVAGLSGALTRIVYLLLMQITSEMFIVCFLSAVAASVFSEIMAVRTKNPSTVFIYPSIVPLLPGGTLYYSIVGLMLQGSALVAANLVPCIHSLAGLGIGFIVISIFMHYRRTYRFRVRRKLLGRFVRSARS
ncbi:MAG: threonine/serine exporter family protein [Clostridiales bacterium]|nr:threonine/serine exporter family protein [Clostridiales bacterium]